MAGKPLIELKNVSKTYAQGEAAVHALRHVSLRVNAGEFVAIMGPSGSGKSTLLHMLGLLDRPDSGHYWLSQKEITQVSDDELAQVRNQWLGFVFQQFQLLPHLNALNNTALPLIYAGRTQQRNLAHDQIQAVGLSSRGHHLPRQMSGGEQQRVAIARALVNDPKLILADEPTGNLDTASEAEILSLLLNLNQKGITIILVTHEREVAKYARRVIHMRDGQIVSDQKKASSRHKADPLLNNLKLPTSQVRLGRAVFSDYFQEAWHAIFSHKMRSFLSMLGILIGIASVITMMALGSGAKEAISQQMASLGSNLLTISSGARHVHGVALEAGAVTRFTLQDAQAIQQIPQVKAVSPMVQGSVQLDFQNKNWRTQVQGSSTEYARMRASEPALGRFFNQEEIRQREKVVLLGPTVALELFDDKNPLNQIIKINRINFRVIGVLPSKGSAGWRNRDDMIVMPVTTAMYRLLGKKYVDSIDVEIRQVEEMLDAEEAIKALIRKRQHLAATAEDTFEIRNMQEIQDAMKSSLATMTWLLSSITAVSLLVGGIGIMNIMLVSVKERVHEIGLRKAIGARRSDILWQFLIEAVLMTFQGGVFGIVLGSLISTLLSLLAGWKVKISPTSLVLAVLFATGVGLIFGLWPARQAAQLRPIDALRYE